MSDHGASHDPSRRDVLSLGSALAAGTALGSVLFSNPQPALAQAAGLKVALVDIGIVFKGYKRKDDLEKQINAKKDQLEAQGKQKATQLEGIRKALDLLNPNSQMFRDKRKELKLAAKEFEVLRDTMDEELKLEVENLTLAILDEIEDRVREFGKSQGYDLIFKIDTKGWGDERFQERIFRAQVSSVLYHDEKLDVTKTVLGMLNQQEWLDKCKAKALGSSAPGPQPDGTKQPPQPPK